VTRGAAALVASFGGRLLLLTRDALYAPAQRHQDSALSELPNQLHADLRLGVRRVSHQKPPIKIFYREK
jgi:hypothetical protein